MKKVILFSIFSMLFFHVFSQSPQFVEVADIDGFQYKSFHYTQDSIWGIRYYSRRRSELAYICKIKSSKEILNYEELKQDLYNLVNSEVPKIKCGKRSIMFGFVYANSLYDEVRIISSDYQIKNKKKFIKKIHKIIEKMSIQYEKRNCFCLFEMTFSVEGNCSIIREKIELKYKD